MRCKKCNEYIPVGLGITHCVKCGADLSEEDTVVEESPLITEIEAEAGPMYDDLTKEQEFQIQQRLHKSVKRLLNASVLWTVIIIVVLIPLRFIPSRNAEGIQGMNTSLSFAEYMGFLPTLFFLLIIGILIYGLVLSHSRFFGLRKDLKGKETITFTARVAGVRELKGDDEKEYDVFLEKNLGRLKKLNYLLSEFPDVKKGDTIKVTLSLNAHFVLTTEIIDTNF